MQLRINVNTFHILRVENIDVIDGMVWIFRPWQVLFAHDTSFSIPSDAILDRDGALSSARKNPGERGSSNSRKRFVRAAGNADFFRHNDPLDIPPKHAGHEE